MPRYRILIIIFTAGMLILFSGLCLASDVDNGFSAARHFETRYFSVSVEDGVDLAALTMAISVPPSIKAVIRQPTIALDELSLQNELDILYLAVSEILDIRLSRFRCKLKICKDAGRLSDIAKRLFGMDIPKTAGFYVAQLDTLYVDAQDISIHVLGHELSHAIQTNYFVVPPPATIQEILSGYVEFQFRKYTNTLPAKKGG